MIVVECEQGSPEWWAARVGCITASMFRIARTKVDGLDVRQQTYVNAILDGQTERHAREEAGYVAAPKALSVQRALAGERVGRPSDAALDYAFRLAIERISGEPLDEGGFETFGQRRGHALEPDARRRHEEEAGVWVERCGFVMTDDRRFGASLDGLINHDGAAEYKAFIDPGKLRSILIDGDVDEIRDQAMGGLWITRRKWIEIGLYCPALASIGKDFWYTRIERDDDYITEMEKDLVEFLRLVDSYEARLREDT